MKKRKYLLYAELVGEMAKRGETQKELGQLIGVNSSAGISRRLSGKIEWSISEVEKICEHYGKDYYTLFKKYED